jgi:diaminopimelate decarboxylase
MQAFTWRDGHLFADEVPVSRIAAAAGTPTYIYSARAIRAAHGRLAAAFAPLRAHLHYAVKASPNLHLCRLLRSLGAGMDVVSGGELERAWLSGTPMTEIVFAGVGKSDAEILAALDGRFSPLSAAEAAVFGLPDPALRGSVGRFNVESESELERISALAAELGKRASFCLRVNPNVDPHTHEYTTTGKKENKFGIDADRIVAVVEKFARLPGLLFDGLHLHIGSPVPQIEPYAEAIAVAFDLIDELERRGHRVSTLNLGGGWPVAYTEGAVPPIEDYAARIVPLLAPRADAGLKIVLEPGRSIIANSGILLARVQHVKHGRAKNFVICDAGMHTLLRPALYRAFHFVWPADWHGPAPRFLEDATTDHRLAAGGLEICDLVGPICETGDFLARDRALPPMQRGDLLAVFSAGAYGMSMTSNYNDHGRPAEVLVDGAKATRINQRQKLSAILSTEAQTADLGVEETVIHNIQAAAAG